MSPGGRLVRNTDSQSHSPASGSSQLPYLLSSPFLASGTGSGSGPPHPYPEPLLQAIQSIIWYCWLHPQIHPGLAKSYPQAHPGPSSLHSHYSLLSFLLLPSQSPFQKSTLGGFLQSESGIPHSSSHPCSRCFSHFPPLRPLHVLRWLPPRGPGPCCSLWRGCSSPRSPHLSSHLPLLALGILHISPFYDLDCSYLVLSCSCMTAILFLPHWNMSST